MAVSLTMLVVFFSGYYVGHQKADTGRGMELNKTLALALPGPAHADTTEYEPHTPQTQIPGANIDVDSPEDEAADSVSEAQTVTHKHKAEVAVEAVIKKTTDIIEKSAASDIPAGQGDRQLQLASLAITPGIFKTGNEAGVIEVTENMQPGTADAQSSNGSIETGDGAEIIDTASAEDARYTIQVGVFADSENAIRRMSELESKNLSAYTNGYTSKRDELRFNVRFGYFKDKSSALAALNRFEQHTSGSGYVTRIRRD